MGDGEGIEQKLGRDLLPEGAQLFEPRLGCVAGDQGRMDRANRNSGDPIGMQICLDESLIYAGLEGAERAAPLQYQGDAVERRPLEVAVAFQERLDERPGFIFGAARPRRFDIDGSGLTFRGQRREASRSISGGHAATIRFSRSSSLEFDRYSG